MKRLTVKALLTQLVLLGSPLGPTGRKHKSRSPGRGQHGGQSARPEQVRTNGGSAERDFRGSPVNAANSEGVGEGQGAFKLRPQHQDRHQNGMVTLRGPVKSEEKQAIEAKAAEIAGSDKVTSEIQVASK